MKIICCWVLLLGLWGCTKERAEEGSIAIRLHSELEASAVSRGVVLNGTPFIGVQFLRKEGTDTPSTFAGAITQLGSRAGTGAINFRGALPTYNPSGVHTYFVAYHPDVAAVNEVATWPVDGKTDILVSSVFDAGTQSVPIPGSLLFKHRLAQVEVILKAVPDQLLTEEELQALWGKVTKIELVDTPTELVYSYATNVVTRGATLANLPLKQKDYDTDFAALTITTNPTNLIAAAGMFAPGLDTDKVKFKVYTGTEPFGKEVEVQLKDGGTLAGFEVGKRHTVTLLFKGAEKNIEVAGTKIAEWGAGAGSELEVELTGQLGALSADVANPIAAEGGTVTITTPNALAGMVWSGSTNPVMGFGVGAFSGFGSLGSMPVVVSVNPTNAERTSVFTATAPNGAESTLTLRQAASSLAYSSLSATTPVPKTATSATFTVTGTSGLTLSFAKTGGDLAFSDPIPATLTCNGLEQTVTVTMAANTGAARQATFSATVTNPSALRLNLTDITVKQETALITWATGNLVANGANGCKIGAAADYGLFFHFGSLVGWSGGANGDGTGTGSPATEVQVKPVGYNATSGNTWPAGYYSGGTTDTKGYDLPADDPVSGIGDPCRYYLGGTWRTPTAAEWLTLLGANGANTTGRAPLTVNNTALSFPASGRRGDLDGVIPPVGSNGSNGYYWSSSVGSAPNNYFLYFSKISVLPQNITIRSTGMSVRCVVSS